MAAVGQEALQDTPTAKEAYIASKEAYIDGKRGLHRCQSVMAAVRQEVALLASYCRITSFLVIVLQV